MVLQERIELSTSPLPRGCSTTELLQRTGRNPAIAAVRAQDPKTKQRGMAHVINRFARRAVPSLTNPLTPICFSQSHALAVMLTE